ncbi:hypothetical protein C8J57DRAFT_1704864 [Mycena rebaudengoi]|nr:hypothetical protein C8J57DRAFT_1704864 [Mycena rebaudengoi]
MNKTTTQRRILQTSRALTSFNPACRNRAQPARLGLPVHYSHTHIHKPRKLIRPPPCLILPASTSQRDTPVTTYVVFPLRITLRLIPARVQLRNLVPHCPPPRFSLSASRFSATACTQHRAGNLALDVGLRSGGGVTQDASVYSARFRARASRPHNLRGGRRRPTLRRARTARVHTERAIEQSGQSQHWAWACEPEAALAYTQWTPPGLPCAILSRRAALVSRYGFMLLSPPYFLLFPSLRLFSRTPHFAPADSERHLASTCCTTPHIPSRTAAYAYTPDVCDSISRGVLHRRARVPHAESADARSCSRRAQEGSPPACVAHVRGSCAEPRKRARAACKTSRWGSSARRPRRVVVCRDTAGLKRRA